MTTELDFEEAQQAGPAAATMGTVEVQPFLAFARGVLAQSDLRARITEAYRRPEEECLPLARRRGHAARGGQAQAARHRPRAGRGAARARAAAAAWRG